MARRTAVRGPPNEFRDDYPAENTAMARIKLTGANLTGLAAVLAISLLAGCDGHIEIAEEARSQQIQSRRSPRATADRAADGDERRSDGDRDERRTTRDRYENASGRDGDHGGATDRGDARQGDDAAAEDIGDADPQLYAIVRSKTIDLEFTPGLPEPPQDKIVPAPAPWAPEPSVEENAAKPVIDDVWPDKAPASGGDKVVIRGKNLQAAQVVFGLSPARILAQSDDAVTVAAPAAGAGQVAIVVTNRDGNYAVAGSAFRYYN
jgi:IPT/TIG domain